MLSVLQPAILIDLLPVGGRGSEDPTPSEAMALGVLWRDDPSEPLWWLVASPEDGRCDLVENYRVRIRYEIHRGDYNYPAFPRGWQPRVVRK